MSGAETRRERGARAGMTLVEMVVAIAIFGIVMGVLFTFLTNSRRSYSDISERVEYQQTLRGAISLISQEIRSAGCDPRNVGFNRFPLADEASLQCRMDLDGDGVIEVVEPAEDVVYAYNAGTDELTRDSGTGPQTILRNVTAMSFRYYDEDENMLGPTPLTLDDRAEVRFIEVDISGESDRGEPVSYVTRLLMRNI